MKDSLKIVNQLHCLNHAHLVRSTYIVIHAIRNDKPLIYHGRLMEAPNLPYHIVIPLFKPMQMTWPAIRTFGKLVNSNIKLFFAIEFD